MSGCSTAALAVGGGRAAMKAVALFRTMVLLEAVPDFLRFPFVKMAKTEIREAKKRERRRQENRQKVRSRAEAEADEEVEAEEAMEEEAVGAGMLPKKRQPTT